MKVILFGYGKMGKAIEEVLLLRGHEVVAIIDKSQEPDVDVIKNADVAIEFSVPECAVDNIYSCFESKLPVVVGTTGWYAHEDEVLKRCLNQEATILSATNFSLGVNVFFEINNQLSSLLAPHGYDIKMKEIHHTEKLDAPSGTAITLAEGIISNTSKKVWVNGQTNEPNQLEIISERIPGVPGTHSVIFESEVDKITFEHEAKSRKGFALGAVIAAEFLQGKTGVFSMKDVLNDFIKLV